jgi:CopG family transcriptional regulator / antitoxin EndoAI
MHKRLNITLPETTVELIEDLAQKGGRSNFIDNAVKFYVKQLKQEGLRERLKEGAIARSRQDLEIAEDWFNLEEELWTKPIE